MEVVRWRYWLEMPEKVGQVVIRVVTAGNMPRFQLEVACRPYRRLRLCGFMRCMNTHNHEATEERLSSAAAPESALPAHAVQIAADSHSGAEVIATELLPPSATGRQSAALRRGTAKQRVRGHETRRRLIELHVHKGLRLKECARDLGIS